MQDRIEMMTEVYGDSTEGAASSIYLRSSGKLYDKTLKPKKDGLLSTLWNFPLRGLLWQLQSAALHRKTQNCIIYDERGQVYFLSMQQNIYKTVRLASTSISAIAFLLSRSTQIVTAYENGDVLMLDTDSDDVIVLSSQCPSMSNSTIRMMRTHPSESIVAMASDDRTISLWDLITLRCIRKLRCEENVLGMEFECDGEMLVVIQEKSGACVYRTQDCEPIAQYVLQKSERCPVWTAYGSYGPVTGQALNVLLAGDNGMLYVWGAIYRGDDRACQIVECLSVVELPVQMHCAVAITSIGSPSTQQPSRIAILSSEGDVLIIDIEAATAAAGGGGGGGSTTYVWTIMAHIQDPTGNSIPLSSFTVGTSSTRRQLHLSESTVDMYSNPPKRNTANTANYGSKYDKTEEIDHSDNIQVSTHNLLSQRGLRAREVCPRDGRICSTGDSMVVLGSDGAARIYSTADSIGCGDIAGTLLRARNAFEERTLRGVVVGTGGGQYHTDTESKGTIEVQRRKKLMEKINEEKMKGLPKRSKMKSRGYEERKDGDPGSKLRTLDSVASKPLFELAEMSPKGQEITTEKLKIYLKKHGHYPAKHRPLIWRFLLRLPENTREYSDLVRRGVHPSYESLTTRLAIGDKRTLNRLHGICSLLAHWSPVFGEVPYIPQMCFPFVLLYGSDELAALETVMSILMWWGHSFHATFPNPPAHITDSIDSLLQIHDPALYQHFEVVGVPAGPLGWTLINSMFSEVLGKDDWAIWMDTLFTNFNRCEVILLAPVAIITAARTSLLTSKRDVDIISYFRRSQSFDMKVLCSILYRLLGNTEAKHLTAVGGYVDSRTKSGSRTMTLQENLDLDSVQQLRANAAASVGVPLLSLPKDRYPAYDGYPVSVVDWQIKEREKAIRIAEEVARRTDSLKELELKVCEMEGEHQQWTARHVAAVEAAQSQQLLKTESERAEFEQILRIEQDIATQHLRSLATVDRIAAEQLALRDTLASKEKDLLAAAEEGVHRRLEMAAELLKYREATAKSSQIETERLCLLQLTASREAMSKSLSEGMKSLERDLLQRDSIQAEKWRAEDERIQAERDANMKALRAIEDDQRLLREREETSEKMMKIEQDRAYRLSEMERDRAARMKAERADVLRLKREISRHQDQIAQRAEDSKERERERERETKEEGDRNRLKELELSIVEKEEEEKDRMREREEMSRAREKIERERMIEKEKRDLHKLKIEEERGREQEARNLILEKEERERAIEREERERARDKEEKDRQRARNAARDVEEEREERIKAEEDRLNLRRYEMGERREIERRKQIETENKMEDMREEEERSSAESRRASDERVRELEAENAAMKKEREDMEAVREGEIALLRAQEEERRRQQREEESRLQSRSKEEKERVKGLRRVIEEQEREMERQRRIEKKEDQARKIEIEKLKFEKMKLIAREERVRVREREETERVMLRRLDEEDIERDALLTRRRDKGRARGRSSDRLRRGGGGGVDREREERTLRRERESESEFGAASSDEMEDSTSDRDRERERESLVGEEEGNEGGFEDVDAFYEPSETTDDSGQYHVYQAKLSNPLRSAPVPASAPILLPTQPLKSRTKEEVLEDKINAQILLEKITFKGEYDMSGAGGYKKGSQSTGVKGKTLSKTEIMNELLKVSASASSAVRGRKSSTKDLSVRLDSDTSPKRDRMVREMHYSKYRVRSTSRPPAPPVRLPDKKFDTAPKVLQRYDLGQRFYPTQKSGVLPPNWAPSMGYPSTPSTLGSTRGKSGGGTGTEIPQSQKSRYERKGYAFPDKEEDAYEEEYERKKEEEMVGESEVEEESGVLGVSESEDRGSYRDDTNKSAEDGDDEGEEQEEEGESHDVSSDADRTGGRGGGAVPVSGEDVVWIDGAPYSDIVSSSSSQLRGSRRAVKAFSPSSLPFGYSQTEPLGIGSKISSSSSSPSSDSTLPIPTHHMPGFTDRGEGFSRDVKLSGSLPSNIYPLRTFGISSSTERSSTEPSSTERSSESSSGSSPSSTSKDDRDYEREPYYSVRVRGDSGLNRSRVSGYTAATGRTNKEDCSTEDSSIEVQPFIPSTAEFDRYRNRSARYAQSARTAMPHSGSAAYPSTGPFGPSLLSPSGSEKIARKSNTHTQTAVRHSAPSLDHSYDLQELADMSVRAVQEVLHESRQERAREARELVRKSY